MIWLIMLLSVNSYAAAGLNRNCKDVEEDIIRVKSMTNDEVYEKFGINIDVKLDYLEKESKDCNEEIFQDKNGNVPEKINYEDVVE